MQFLFFFKNLRFTTKSSFKLKIKGKIAFKMRKKAILGIKTIDISSFK